MKNKFIAEFIGTFFLYLIIGMCVFPPGAGEHTPLAVGIGLVALVCAKGHISKAHFNPAITFAYLTTRTISKKELLPFLAAEFIGAALAALVVSFLKPDFSTWAEALDPIQTQQAIVAEILFTFALAWVILNVAIAKGTAGNGFYAIAIGAIVTAAAYTVGPISFAALNPAVTMGFCINGAIPWSLFPLYTGVQVITAVAAALLFNSMKLADE